MSTVPPRPLVSVVMPVRNERGSIDEAIDSVLRQTCSDLEVIVVDGRSTDGTAERVAEVAACDARVRLADNPDRTIPHALNIGLAHARGTYLARVDAHAGVNDEYVARGVRWLERELDVAGVGGQRRGVARTRSGRAVAAVLSSPFGVGDSINHYATSPQDSDHASFGVYRVEVLRAVGGWDEALLVNEDVDLDHRILAAGHRLRYDPDMHILWHVRESVPDFARQYRRYGRGKALMVRKNGSSAVRLRHLAPPALVVCLAVAGGLAAAGRGRAAIALAAPYGLALSVAGTRTARGTDLAVRDVVPAFAAMHLSWGLGFLEGLLLGRRPVASSAREPAASS